MKTSNKKVVTIIMAAMFMVVAVAGLAVAEDSIVGIVAADGDIIVIQADDGTYVLEGSGLTAEHAGKKVKVTGTIAEKDDMKVISVLSMEEVTE